MMLCAAAALILCALAPSIGVLLLAIIALGLTTVAGQILTPGWGAIAIAGMTLSCLALAIWAAGRRSALLVPEPR
ncbi:hypothetical protein Aph01nite_41250 [Acrocarpospora phusangensis]|uniref:Uncharacterized protein n=1 Tax=Acrocarpospora phusangensis TaxID=1070424 RepID=A0A919QEC8_9ACTN|nr:hypothetical protein [Acrocarpospora phusangensis]GIH25815.1 hypothetical protein Aph01nite_41250 [Acrocarpospora phusangensis]